MRRRLGKLIDTKGKPLPCAYCDRWAVIKWRNELLCLAHFRADDLQREAEACRRNRNTVRERVRTL